MSEHEDKKGGQWHSAITKDSQKRRLRERIESMWSAVAVHLGAVDDMHHDWNPRLRPRSPCLKQSPSTSCSMDSLVSDTRSDKSKAVSFSEKITTHETYTCTKYPRKGYNKRPMTHAEIDRIITEVNRYKALDMELHPESLGNIHWMKKTIPGEPRMTDLAMARLRRMESDIAC